MIADLGNTPLKIVRLVDPQMAATMAESVLAWTLYLHRGMPAYARQQQQRIWREHPYVCPQSRTVSLLGLGTLGSASAQRLLTAGFKVCGWSRAPKTVPGIECFSGDTGLTAMLLKTDTLVLSLIHICTNNFRELVHTARPNEELVHIFTEDGLVENFYTMTNGIPLFLSLIHI